jgi:hypothetical protein
LGTTVLQSWNSFLGWILVYPFLGFLNLLDHGVFSECLEVIYWTTVLKSIWAMEFLNPIVILGLVLILKRAINMGLTRGLLDQFVFIIFV